MFGRDNLSDKELSKTVNSRLARTGTRVTATVNRGVVTLVGKLQYPAQRIPVTKTASQISGVRQVIDQMQVAQKKSFSPPPQAASTFKPVAKPVEQPSETVAAPADQPSLALPPAVETNPSF